MLSLLVYLSALAHLTSAYPQNLPLRGGSHEERAVETSIDLDYVTVTHYVTAWATEQNHGFNGWRTWPTSSTGVSTTSTSEAAPVSTAPTTTSSIPSLTETYPSQTSSSALSSSETHSSPTTSTTQSSVFSATMPSLTTYLALSSYASSTLATVTTSSSAASSTGISKSNLTPNGRKAGLSGYVGIQNTDAFSQFAQHISWYSDYTPNTPTEQGVTGVGMLWGASGSTCGSVETERLQTFTNLVKDATVPEIMFGFYEPDCTCPMSSDMSVSSAAAAWDSLVVPLAAAGTVLGSPSMCKQKDEDFLTPFGSSISKSWDVTSVHINKPNVTEAQKDIEYFVNTYKKPVWVTEFACVHDQPSWEPCTDQDEINQFINDVVKYFEGNDDVVAYGPSNGEGLGTVWPLTTTSGELTTSGQTYLNAIKAL